MLGPVVHDVGGDLDDVGEACAGGGERQADVAHALRRLRGEVADTDDLAAFVDGHRGSKASPPKELRCFGEAAAAYGLHAAL